MREYKRHKTFTCCQLVPFVQKSEDNNMKSGLASILMLLTISCLHPLGECRGEGDMIMYIYACLISPANIVRAFTYLHAVAVGFNVAMLL